ncbi:hypothetical protein WA026_002742 [Henosepilachna vigintioctopunctata]|uniref:Protein HGH1 homolog n=1 Tax=Henosepilachna vigintioctopunctata TaxID=420089 RepID=A0AAW1U0J6_9CUCU
MDSNCTREHYNKLPQPPEELIKNLKELLKFLQLGARLDLKAIALDSLLSMTGSEDGIRSVLYVEEILISLIGLLQDNNIPITKDAASCLINLSADLYGHILLSLSNKYCPPLQHRPGSIIGECFKQVFNKESSIADECCMILSNLSRGEHSVALTYDLLQDTIYGFDDIINIFTKVSYNEKGGKLHYLGPWLSNMTQDKRVREYILNPEKCVIQRLLPYTEYKESIVRRGGIIGTLRNCCFDVFSNGWLLGDEVDILPRLLLPLAGGEEFDDEDNDKLPLELQYLPESKMREPDPDIRKMLIEAITQLCTEKKNREFIRDKNTYIILRELHKWEKDNEVLTACENLVDMLIRTEEEIGCENLKEMKIPDDVSEKLNKLEL